MRDIKYIILLLAAAIAALFLITGGHAADNITENITQIETPSQPIYSYYPPYRPMQGDRVYVNDTIDISGMGINTVGIAWFGKYSQYEDPQYIYQYTDYKRGLYDFWLDPSIFESRTGEWYQYYGSNKTEKRGNLLAFYVVNGFRNTTVTYQNGTVVNISEQVTNRTPILPTKVQVLPEVHVSDYLVAKGYPLAVTTGSEAHVWIFGSTDGIYDRVTKYSSITFTSGDITSLKPGQYTILVQHSGKNTIFEADYENQSIVSPWSKVKPISVYSQTPENIRNILIRFIGSNTDDTYDQYQLEVQEPSIQITRFDEVGLGAREYEFRSEEGAVTLMDVRGYTNLPDGSIIRVTLDKGSQHEYTDSAVAVRDIPGNSSIFHAYVPLIWNHLSLGMHTISASNGNTVAYADFPVEQMPADSYRPNGTLKFVGSRNPWVPTPTPEKVTVIKTVVIERTVEVTPSDSQVKEQQKIAIGELAVHYGIITVVILMCAIVAYLVIRFLYRSYQRKRYQE